MDTITITFPEVKVKIPIKGLTFDILKICSLKYLKILARRVFEEVTRGKSTRNQKNFFHQRKLPPKC